MSNGKKDEGRTEGNDSLQGKKHRKNEGGGMKDFIETRIKEAVRKMLVGKVNEILLEYKLPVPAIECSNYGGFYSTVPTFTLNDCERTEKERLLRIDAYTVTISFALLEMPEEEMYCYAYCGAVKRALKENPTLDGVVERADIIGKKYTAPKKPGCGEGWGVVITLRITIENEQ